MSATHVTTALRSGSTRIRRKLDARRRWLHAITRRRLLEIYYAMHPRRELLSLGRRATVSRPRWSLRPTVVKRFARTDWGQRAFERELLAAFELGDQPWKLTPLNWSDRMIEFPALADQNRLDRAAATAGPEARRRLAGRALSIVLDLYIAGFAHRDFHSQNLFVDGDQLVLIDFEALCRIDPRPPFLRSYDITGRGLTSLHHTNHMGYSAPKDQALNRVLGVPLPEATDELARLLRDELHQSSLTFKRRSTGKDDRHRCRSELTYCSLSVPGLTIEPSEAQRDIAIRMAQFGLDDATVRGTRVLDLGSNIGAMSLTLAQMGATSVLGLEYDSNKVRVARRVAAFGGVTNVEFRTADLDSTMLSDVDGPYDVVMCLAIDAHVEDPDHLFALLGDVTSGFVCFEGNQGADMAQVSGKLRSAGFTEFEDLGTCRDDAREANNVRPLLIAHKP